MVARTPTFTTTISMSGILGKPHFAAIIAVGASLIVAACGGSDSDPKIERSLPLTLSQQDSCNVDLATTPPHVTIFGADAGDFLADRFSLAAGDFNDDGADDLLIGAPLADGPGNSRDNAGEAYIVFGRAEPPSVIDLAEVETLTVFGQNPGDNLGFTVAVGDLNADGIDDALIGARFASPEGRANAGAVYVLSGKTSLADDLDLARQPADFTVIGSVASQLLSIALASGDLNGDGVDDLLIGAAGADGPDGDRRDAGSAIAILGGASLPTLIDLASESPALTVHGATAGDSIPNYLAAGDLDSDGDDELIVGAPAVNTPDREDAGRTYVIKYNGDGEVVDLAQSDDVMTITGGERKDALGFEVASGDVNGDGAADLIVGARDADGPADQINNGGEIHVFFGGDDLPRSVDLKEGSSDLMIHSTNPGDSLGFSVAVADLNGDGIDDILAGAPLADGCDNGAINAGDVYVILGRETVPESIALDNAGDLTYFGASADDVAGFSVAAADFNGDGREDLVIGALQADGPDDSRPDAGEVYVILQ